MGDGDEGAGGAGAAREFGAALRGRRRRKVERQADSENVPQLADRGRHRVQLGADQRREIIGARAPRVGDRPAETSEEMLGQLQEVVAVAPIGGDHRVGREAAVGERRMRVEIAAPETSGRREGGEREHDASNPEGRATQRASVGRHHGAEVSARSSPSHRSSASSILSVMPVPGSSPGTGMTESVRAPLASAAANRAQPTAQAGNRASRDRIRGRWRGGRRRPLAACRPRARAVRRAPPSRIGSSTKPPPAAASSSKASPLAASRALATATARLTATTGEAVSANSAS